MSKNRRSVNTMVQIIGVISILHNVFMGGCKGAIVDPPPVKYQNEKKWLEIKLFKNVDVMYMLQYKDRLYVSGILKERLFADSASILFTTIDGDTWDTLKIFDRPIGPLAFYGDTLTVLASDETWKYHPSFGWVMFWEHYIAADHAFDMFWLNDELFVFSNSIDRVYSKDSVRRGPNTPYISRFVKHKYNGKEIYYTRPYFVYKDNIYRFDGNNFEPVMNGISADENKNANYPSMFVHNDTFYAGFNTPSRIKKLVNNVWMNVTDTIPNTIDANLFSPSLLNRPTAITFCHNKLFVGTEWTGVLEWTNNGWIPITNGLQLEFPNFPQYKLYRAIVFLESFKGKLFVAYGMPFYAPVADGKGMLCYTIE